MVKVVLALTQEDARVSILSEMTGGLLAYYIGIAIVALPGLIGVLLIGRMHRAALRDCRALRNEVSQAEQTTGRIRCLMADLVATMNLSLAGAQAGAIEVNRQQIEELRQAAEAALKGPDEPQPAASASRL